MVADAATRDLLPELQNRLFGAQDTVCLARARLATEAWFRHAADPPPIRRAMTLAHILENMPLDLESNPVFAGNASSAPRAWSVNPEFGFEVDPQGCIEHDWLHPDWLRRQIPPALKRKWRGHQLGSSAGTGHLAIDLDAVVNRGLRAMLADLSGCSKDRSRPRRDYRAAMAISLGAVIAWAHRYADAAEAAARTCTDPAIAACHRRVADACRQVPEYPARNLFDGLQAIALVHLALSLEGQGVSISIGLPDRALARFAEEAAAEMEQAATWCGAFLLKIAANSYHGRVSKTQAITLGGADHKGKDQCNAVTMAFLKAYERVAVSDPHCFLRWHKGIHPDVWDQTLRLLSAGRSMPLLVNDHVAARGLIAAGMKKRDAWDYCIIGCNEIGVPGRAWQTACTSGLAINDLACVDAVIRGNGRLSSAGQVVEAYHKQVLATARKGITARRQWIKRKAEQSPFPLTSALMHGCREAGADYQLAMPYSDIYACYTRGTTNAVNALAALDAVAFGKSGMGLGEFLRRLDHGDQDLLRQIAACPRWGNDDDRADRWGVALNEARQSALDQAARGRGVRLICCHVVRSLHHLDGRRIGPTADGRPAGQPVADSIGAAAGEARLGPTAMLNSVLKLNAARDLAGIYNLNLTLPGGAQSSPQVLRALCEAFFLDGGQELQINVLDAAKLREAQQHPERFGDLVVRIAGLNARFVELSRLEQDELIRRAEAAAVST